MKLSDLFTTKKPCNCKLCQNSRRYTEIVAGLDSEDDRTFMLALYDHYIEVEAELEMMQAYERGELPLRDDGAIGSAAPPRPAPSRIKTKVNETDIKQENKQ